MKIDRQGSLKFKKAKRNKYKNVILIELTVGAILISSAFFLKTSTNVESDNLLNSSTVYAEVETTDYSETIAAYVPTPAPTVTVTPKLTATKAPTPSPIPTVTTSPKATAKPVRKSDDVKEKKLIALSFDDGPSKKLTPKILKILEDNDCHATFFVIGNLAEQYPQIVSDVYDAGNEIGNHSYDHNIHFTELTKKQMIRQIEKTNEAIYEATDEYPTFFRAPGGNMNDKMKDCIDLPFAYWSIDSNDWRDITDKEVINNIIPNLKEGSIILCHDIKPRTLKIIEDIILQIQDLGYEIVSLSEMFEYYDVDLEDGHVYSKAKKN